MLKNSVRKSKYQNTSSIATSLQTCSPITNQKRMEIWVALVSYSIACKFLVAVRNQSIGYYRLSVRRRKRSIKQKSQDLIAKIIRNSKGMVTIYRARLRKRHHTLLLNQLQNIQYLNRKLSVSDSSDGRLY